MNAVTNARTAADLNTIVTRKRGAAQFDAIIAAQQTEIYKAARAKFDRLSVALRSVDGKRRNHRQVNFMSWSTCIDSRDGLRLIVVDLDAAAGCIRVTLREVGQPDQVSTLAQGLSYAAIAKCCDAILNG